MNEARAIKELRKGSEDALRWLIDLYTPYVNSIVYNIIGQHMSAADIEEVNADVFIALWHNAAKIRPASIKSWLGSVARNTAKNKLRGLGRELPLEDDMILVEDVTPENEVERHERQQLVYKAVLGMDWPDREIFLRHYYYCQTATSIADEMGMSLSAIKARLSRGREKLRSVLTQNHLNEGGAFDAIENF